MEKGQLLKPWGLDSTLIGSHSAVRWKEHKIRDDLVSFRRTEIPKYKIQERHPLAKGQAAFQNLKHRIKVLS